MKLLLQDKTMTLLPEKAIYLEDSEILLVADTHFGKSGTFRQAGVAVPKDSNTDGISRLERLIHRIKPKRCIILGDFFHSRLNQSWEEVANWTRQQRDPVIELVKGNHDVLGNTDYARAGIIVHEDYLDIEGFRLIHDADTQTAGSQKNADITNCTRTSDESTGITSKSDDGAIFTISGHLHPGIRMKGYARQSMMLPCFHLNNNGCILPAFGTFTGLAEVRVTSESRTFVPIPQDNIVLEITRKSR